MPIFPFIGRGETAPNHLQIFANHPNIVDFSEAETAKAQLDISLLQGESNVVEYPLRVAAFASINSVSLFFVRDFTLVHNRSSYYAFRASLSEVIPPESIISDSREMYYN